MAKACPATAIIFATTCHSCTPIVQNGTSEQKARFLTPMARGEVLGAFCLTEPQAGSDASNLRTRAVRKGNGWVLNGTKQFITSGRSADVALVFAVTDPANVKRGISCFIVPTRTAGYRVASVEKKLGQRGSNTAEVILDQVRVPAGNLLGEEQSGHIKEVGIELYQNMLEETVAELKSAQELGLHLFGELADLI